MLAAVPIECCPLSISVVDATTVAVRGDVDQATAPVLATVAASPTVERIDLSGVTFMGVAAIEVLLTARERGVTLLAPSRCVTRVLELLGRCTAPA